MPILQDKDPRDFRPRCAKAAATPGRVRADQVLSAAWDSLPDGRPSFV